MYNNVVSMEILTPSGNAVTEYKKDGETYIEGRKGSEYSIRVKNNSNKKILAVVSVDGLDVIEGKEANYKSRGYILNPYESTIIEGWRTDNNHIRKFYFADKFYDSYSQKTGHGTQNTGVIGLAVFYPKAKMPVINNWDYDIYFPKYWYQPDGHYPGWGAEARTLNAVGATTETLSAQSYNTSSLSKSAATRRIKSDENVATGMGRKEESRVTASFFERADYPVTVFQMQYRTRKELERLGIKIHSRITEKPNAFPAQPGFCQEV